MYIHSDTPAALRHAPRRAARAVGLVLAACGAIVLVFPAMLTGRLEIAISPVSPWALFDWLMALWIPASITGWANLPLGIGTVRLMALVAFATGAWISARR
jgi:hypothetical protein